jgi:hypothetical protein
MPAVPAPPSAGPRSQAGFSFIEVIIAMSVLIVGSVSVLGLFAIGVNRMVDRRVNARLEQVRPEIDSILQSRLDAADPGKPPQPITVEQAEQLSRRGYALAVTWNPSPWGTPGYLAHADLLFNGRKVRSLIIPVRRSVLRATELESPAGD